MKYPISQFAVLVDVLKQFAVHIDIKSVNPSALHFMVYQQISNGQRHCALYCIGNELKKFHSLTESERETARKFIENDFDFLLYPNDCNDTNIETAVKRAIKEMYQC